MHYNKIFESLPNEYQGESFKRSLGKSDGSVWEDNENASYILVNSKDVTIKEGSLMKSENSFTLTISLSDIDTMTLLGNYRLLCFANKTDDDTFNDVIGEYEITYNSKKAKS